MERDFSDEKRLQDDVKDMARRLHTLEDQYANLPGVQQTGTPRVMQTPAEGAGADDDYEKRLAAAERAIKRLQARVKDVEADPEPVAPGGSLPNPFAASEAPVKDKDPKK